MFSQLLCQMNELFKNYQGRYKDTKAGSSWKLTAWNMLSADLQPPKWTMQMISNTVNTKHSKQNNVQ